MNNYLKTQIEDLHEHLSQARQIYEEIGADIEEENEDIYQDLDDSMTGVEEAEDIIFSNFLAD